MSSSKRQNSPLKDSKRQLKQEALLVIFFFSEILIAHSRLNGDVVFLLQQKIMPFLSNIVAHDMCVL